VRSSSCALCGISREERGLRSKLAFPEGPSTRPERRRALWNPKAKDMTSAVWEELKKLVSEGEAQALPARTGFITFGGVLLWPLMQFEIGWPVSLGMLLMRSFSVVSMAFVGYVLGPYISLTYQQNSLT
jgi:hypothetical protein